MPLPEVTQFDLPAPPAIEVPQPPQVAMILLPVLTTGSILLFGIVSKQITLVILGVLVSIGAMATPVLMSVSAKRAAKRRNERRHRRYGELIDDLASRVAEAAAAIKLSIETAHPSPDDLIGWITAGRLWERRRSDPDFLDVAVGLADVPSGLTVQVGQNNALDVDVIDDLQTRADELAKSARVLSGSPLCLSLREHCVLSVEGPREQALGLARAMVLEALVCCGADELALLVAAPPATEHDWEWAGRVPHALHHRDAGRSGPGLVTSGEDLSTVLGHTVGPRVQLLAESEMSVAAAGFPHLLIVLDVYDPLSELQETPSLQDALSRAGELGITVLAIPHAVGAGPAESTTIVTVDERGAGVVRPARSTGANMPFSASRPAARAADLVAATISTKKLVTDLSFAGDQSGDLLLDLLSRRPLPARPGEWAPLPPDDFLTATFGLQSDGRPFRLNLKEGAAGGDGPHGLLVGATGSGKSELLRSLVASLALTHSPDWLQMAFVDFKGGAAFELPTRLPHCVGMITNILDDLSLIERMRSSLTGELSARERQLASAGCDGIRGYWAARDSNVALPPMPYLLVIIDEFAELLDADPDFLDVLLAIGRKGRSLGVHLILSSQRLEAGRIRGLESHLSYRIALRTFNAEESTIAIGSKAAAELPPLAGHGYFRAAESFVRFKASQVSVDGGGPVPAPPMPGARAESAAAWHDEAVTDLVRVVNLLSWVPKAPPLWLRPLPNTARGDLLAIDDGRLALSSPRYGMPVAVGLLDDPRARTQPPDVIDTARAGGHAAIIGAPQSGKSSALATVLLHAALAYPASELRYFVLDFGGGQLAALRELPNVGSYVTAQQPDRVARVMAEMLTLLDERAVESPRDADPAVTATSAGGATTVLVIDNYAAFKERYPEHEQVVERVLVEGGSFGLHLHVTSGRWMDISARKLDQIATRIELRLNEPTDSQYGRAKAKAIQTSGPGRGLSAFGMQLQFAAPFVGLGVSAPGSLGDVAAAVAKQARLSWSGQDAPQLLLLDDLTATKFTAAQDGAPQGHVLVGVSESHFRPVLFEPGRSGNLMLFGDLSSGRTATLARMLCGSAATGPLGVSADVYVVDFRGDLLDALGPDAKPLEAATSSGELASMIENLSQQLAARMDGAPGTGTWRPILLVVDDFDLVQAMTLQGKQPFLAFSSNLLLPQRLRFSVIVNQLGVGSTIRAGDPLIKRALESGAWRMHFSFGSRIDTLPGGIRGRRLPPGVATVLRPGQPEALVRTLSP